MTKANTKRVLRITGIVFVVLLAAVYGYMQTHDALTGPQIVISTPQNGSTLNRQLTTIAGVVTDATEITLNDKEIFITEEGNFEEQLLLARGYSILEITARDRFGKETTQHLELIYTP